MPEAGGCKHIIWDWNGTLLDDTWLSAEACSAAIAPLGFEAVTVERYRRLFCFPIVKFYEALGLDLSRCSYPELANRFHDIYESRLQECRIFDDARDVLERVRARGMTQSLLSALPHRILEGCMAQWDLAPFFTSIRGLDHNLADSKVANGRAWMAAQSLGPDQMLLVGDTDHDLEAAEALGVKCVLIARGYQDRARLDGLGVPVLDTLRDLPEWLERSHR
jgi:phosphoglycolate phosphatase